MKTDNTTTEKMTDAEGKNAIDELVADAQKNGMGY